MPITSNTRPRQPLDRQRIARTALELLGHNGISGLTMRSLGAALGVEAMTLYHHFRNKAELLEGIKDHMLDKLQRRVGAGGTPLERIKATFLHLRQMALEHPDIIPSLGASTFRTPRSMAFFEDLIGQFYALGLDTAQSARYYGLLLQYTLGSGLFAVGAHNPFAVQMLDKKNAVRFPLMQEVLPYSAMTFREENYQFGIGLILSAMQDESSTSTQLSADDQATIRHAS